MDMFNSIDKNSQNKSISLKQQIKHIKQISNISPSKVDNYKKTDNHFEGGSKTELIHVTSPSKILQLNKLRQLSKQNSVTNNNNNNNLNTPKYKPVKTEKNSPFSCSSSSNLIKIYRNDTPTKVVNNFNKSGTQSTLVNGVSSEYLKLRQKRGISPAMNGSFTNSNIASFQQKYYQQGTTSQRMNNVYGFTFSPSKSYDNTNIGFIPNNQINQLTPPIIISHNISNNMNQQQYMSIYNNPPSLNAIRFNNWKYNNLRPQIIPSNSKSTQIIKKQLSKHYNSDSNTNESNTPTIPDNNNNDNNKNINIINNNNKTESETERFPSRKIPSQPIFYDESPKNNKINVLPAIPPTETATEMREEISDSDSTTVSATVPTSSASEVTKTKLIEMETPSNVVINMDNIDNDNENDSNIENDSIKWLIKKDEIKKKRKISYNKSRLSISQTPNKQQSSNKMPIIDDDKEISYDASVPLPIQQSPTKYIKNNKRDSKSYTNTVIIHDDLDESNEFSWNINKNNKLDQFIFDESSPQSIISPLSMPVNLNKCK